MMRTRVGTKEVNTSIVAAYDKKPRYRTLPEGESRTKQSFQEETNINNIMKKYDRETMAEMAAKNPGRFLDLPGGIDYQAAMNITINAKASFDALPGTIRAMFDNDAEEFLYFMENPENDQEIEKLGLREPEEPEPIETPAKGGAVEEPSPNIEPVPE